MEWATFAVIVGATGYAFYDHHPWFGMGCLVLLALYSKRGVIEGAVSGISRVDFSHGKAKLKIVRDVRGDLERMMTSAQISRLMKGEILKVIAKIHSIEPDAKRPVNRMAPVMPRYITRERAIDIVQRLPEIQAFEKTGAKVIFIANGPEAYAVPGAEHPTYMIQVAQDVREHLATFDWVYVDAVTGEVVSKEVQP